MAYSGDDSILKFAVMGGEWGKQIEGRLQLNLAQLLPSISQVPEYAKGPDSESYTPRLVGLGPFNHFRLQLWENTAVKSRFVEQGLRRLNFPDDLDAFTEQVVSPSLPAIRAQYDAHFDIPDSTLASAVAIDVLFLVELLRLGCSDEEEDYAFSSRRSTVETVLMSDVVMLENQIPLFLLHDRISGSDGQTLLFDSQLRKVCQQMSPLQFPLEDGDDLVPGRRRRHRPRHLLEYLYFQIVGGHVEEDSTTTDCNCELDSRDLLQLLGLMEMAPAAALLRRLRREHEHNTAIAHFDVFDLWSDAFRTLGERYLKRAGILAVFVPIITEDSNFKILKRLGETSMPTASGLTQNLALKILPAGGGGHTSLRAMVSFDEQEKTLRLPVLTLKPNCGPLVRNLLAYESMTKNDDDDRVLVAYWRLMNSLVRTAEDMKVLREAGVVVVIDTDDDDDDDDIGRKRLREMMPSTFNANQSDFIDDILWFAETRSGLESQIQALIHCYNHRRLWAVIGRKIMLVLLILFKIEIIIVLIFAAVGLVFAAIHPVSNFVAQFVSFDGLRHRHWPCCPQGFWPALLSLVMGGFLLQMIRAIFSIW